MEQETIIVKTEREDQSDKNEYYKLDFSYPLDENLILMYGQHKIYENEELDKEKIRSFNSWSIWDIKKMEKLGISHLDTFFGFEDYNW